MAATFQPGRPDDVAGRVLRRARVSKMTRALQDRLALANVKIQNGWQNLSLDAIEPHVEERLRRKRPASSVDTISDTASTTSSRVHSSVGLASSPLTEPVVFLDELPRSGGSHRNKRIKSLRATGYTTTTAPASASRARGPAARQTWKKNYRLPESSPIKGGKHLRFHPTTMTSNLSLISEGSTVPDGTPSPEFSEDDDTDLPVSSFAVHTSARIASSPPRTPPPERRMRRIQNVSWSRTPKNGEEGPGLLMYLKNSPSQANMISLNKTTIHPPTTPPCKSTPLPSSHMTPGTSGNGFLNFGPTTPGTAFNFGDFVVMSPSPAQPSWMHTPNAGPTPGTSTRRRLNFDSLMPPNTSPALPRNSAPNQGLGMELGGELVS